MKEGDLTLGNELYIYSFCIYKRRCDKSSLAMETEREGSHGDKHRQCPSGIFQAKEPEKSVVPNGREFELPNLSVSHYLHTDEALE